MISFRPRLFLAMIFLTGTSVLIAQEPPQPSNLWPDKPVPGESDATSLKIIQLHLKARGGESNLESIRNVRFTGTIVEGLVDRSMTATLSRPNSIHVKLHRYHLGYDNTSIEASNGKQAWNRILQPELGLPKAVGGKSATFLDLEAVLTFLFSDMKDLGGVYAYKGEKKIAGRKAYVLHGWLPSGMQIDVFFDTKTFHIINYRHPHQIASKLVLVDRMPTGLVNSQNVWWENGYTLQHRGKIFQTVTYDKVEANIDLDPEMFAMPKVKEFWLRPKE